MKMMAGAMVLPDWLYKNQKRLMVDTVEVAIVDGASRPSDHANGVWALSEIDDLLEIDGVAACMAQLRRRFGRRVQQLLEVEARKAIGVNEQVVTVAAEEVGHSSVPIPSQINLNGPGRTFEEDQAACLGDDDLARDDRTYDDVGADVFGPCDEIEDDAPTPVFFRVGYARRPAAH